MDPRELLCDVMRTLHDRGLLNVKGGNASIRGGEDFIWITPSKQPKHRLAPDDIILMYLDGSWRGAQPPSIEYKMHLRIYREYPWVNAIVHAHNPMTVLAYDLGINIELGRYVESAVSIPCVEVVGRYPPGSDELANAVKEAVSRCPTVVLLGHGVVAVAKDIYTALNAVEAVEDIAKISIMRALYEKLNSLQPISK